MLQLLWIHVHAISVSQPGKRLPNGTQMITIKLIHLPLYLEPLALENLNFEIFRTVGNELC